LLSLADDGPSEILADAVRLVSEADTLYELLMDEPTSDVRIQQFIATVPRAESKVGTALGAAVGRGLSVFTRTKEG
jgi:hypothetical protein